MWPGVRPIMRLASLPTARMAPFLVLIATTLGSLSTIPRPRTYTSVFAVPRSTAMSRPKSWNVDSWRGGEDMAAAVYGTPSRARGQAGGGGTAT